MIQIEKRSGCKVNGVEQQYPEAKQSVIQKAKYESQNLSAKIKIPKLLKDKLNNKKIKKSTIDLKNL